MRLHPVASVAEPNPRDRRPAACHQLLPSDHSENPSGRLVKLVAKSSIIRGSELGFMVAAIRRIP